MKNASKDKNLTIIILLSIIFFFIYSYISFQFSEKFNSPDEAANYYFINHFIANSNFNHHEPLNSEFANLLHPRNSLVIENDIVPLGFLGFPLFVGILGKLISSSIIFFIVPFFSSLAAIFFYLLIKQIFSKKIAFISSIILLIHPAYWYFSSLSMHHNALFASFFIISLYFFIKLFKKPNFLRYYILFSIFAGITITIRTNELIWLAILFFSLLFFYKNNIKIKYLFISMLCLLFVLYPFFHYNNATYSGPFSTGYSHKVDIDLVASITNEGSNKMSKFIKILAPSGIRPAKIIDSAYQYLIVMYPIYSLLVIAGLIIMFKNKNKLNKRVKFYFIYFIIFSIYLIFYYGGGYYFGASGIDSDYNLSSSLIRYWLPLYIFSIPFVSIAILYLIKIIENNNLKLFTFIILLFSLIAFSYTLVFHDKNFGLLKIKNNSILYEEISSELNNYLDNDSIIISDNADKFIFPDFKVIGTNLDIDNFFLNDKIAALIINKSAEYKIYYFTMAGINNFEEISKRLRIRGIEITPVDTIKNISSLYVLTRAF